ncbi:hypothetical protein VTJ49DRAFT_5375 [Mycothermus thermophilus]|uniref:C3H1-type domain-containing protein n=1 Tax=Humicola insolens TaxID=85995 RepID=A0ABR3V495_HUMIN
MMSTEQPRTPRFQTQDNLQKLSGYYAELRDLMDDGGAQSSDRPLKTVDGEHKTDEKAKSTASSSDENYQPYRQGQTSALKQFARFDQTYRSIASDNWRVREGCSLDLAPRSNPVSASAGRLANPDHTSSVLAPSSTQGQPMRQPSVVYTPTRSPRTAPITGSSPAAGFDQGIPVPPPTPESLSTPVSTTSRGGGNVNDSSTTSLTSPLDRYSPPTRDITSQVDIGALQIRGEVGRQGNTVTDNNNNDEGNSLTALINANHDNTNPSAAGPGSDTSGSTSFTVTISADTLGYCFVRADGSRTRLVPVDMLPYQLQGIPTNEPANDLLVPLPIPAGVGPDGRSSNSQTLTAVSLIGGDGGGGDGLSNTPGNPGGGPKRVKIYCDKWVHEGVCAFTQQGCKYKHEMPTDKATQHQLGLFLGYPVWWKRRQGELARMSAQNGQNRVVSARGLDTTRPALPESTMMERYTAWSGQPLSNSNDTNSGASTTNNTSTNRANFSPSARNTPINTGLAASRWSNTPSLASAPAIQPVTTSWRNDGTVQPQQPSPYGQQQQINHKQQLQSPANLDGTYDRQPLHLSQNYQVLSSAASASSNLSTATRNGYYGSYQYQHQQPQNSHHGTHNDSIQGSDRSQTTCDWPWKSFSGPRGRGGMNGAPEAQIGGRTVAGTGLPACNFSTSASTLTTAPTPSTVATPSAGSPSPYGPIAPPIRHHTTTSTALQGNTLSGNNNNNNNNNNHLTISSNSTRGTSISGGTRPNPAREIPNPYAAPPPPPPQPTSPPPTRHAALDQSA